MDRTTETRGNATQLDEIIAVWETAYGRTGSRALFEDEAPSQLRSAEAVLALPTRFSIADAAVRPDLFGYTAVVALYQRPGVVGRMLDALLAQTHPPSAVWFSVFASPVVDAVLAAVDDAVESRADALLRAGPGGRTVAVHVVRGTVQLKYHARFQLALQVRTPFTVLFDDDCVPQPRFVELALRLLHAGVDLGGGREEALLGLKGHRAEGIQDRALPMTYYGPLSGTDATHEADVVGGAWFARTAWLRWLWREEQAAFATGEDYSLSFAVRKHLGLHSVVLPHAAPGSPATDSRGVSDDYLALSDAGSTTVGTVASHSRPALAATLALRGYPLRLRSSISTRVSVSFVIDAPLDAAVARAFARSHLRGATLAAYTAGVLATGRGLVRPPTDPSLPGIATHLEGIATLAGFVGAHSRLLRTASLALFEDDAPTLAAAAARAAVAAAAALRANPPRVLLLHVDRATACHTGSAALKHGIATAAAEAGVPVLVLLSDSHTLDPTTTAPPAEGAVPAPPALRVLANPTAGADGQRSLWEQRVMAGVARRFSPARGDWPGPSSLTAREAAAARAVLASARAEEAQWVEAGSREVPLWEVDNPEASVRETGEAAVLSLRQHFAAIVSGQDTVDGPGGPVSVEAWHAAVAAADEVLHGTAAAVVPRAPAEADAVRANVGAQRQLLRLARRQHAKLCRIHLNSLLTTLADVVVPLDNAAQAADLIVKWLNRQVPNKALAALVS